MLHREHRELDPGHAPHLPRPEAGRVDDVLGVDLSLVGDHPPEALAGPSERLHPGVTVDLGAEPAGGAGVRMGDPRGVDVAVDEGLHAAHEALRIEERHQLVRFLGSDDLRLDPEVTPLRDEPLDPLEALLGRREHDPARHVESRLLPRQLLDLPVDLDRVLLELGDVGVAVDGVHASRRMPGGPGGELGAFDEHHVRPAELGEMVEDGTADHAAPDHDHARVRLHGNTNNDPIRAKDGPIVTPRALPRIRARSREFRVVAGVRPARRVPSAPAALTGGLRCDDPHALFRSRTPEP